MAAAPAAAATAAQYLKTKYYESKFAPQWSPKGNAGGAGRKVGSTMPMVVADYIKRCRNSRIINALSIVGEMVEKRRRERGSERVDQRQNTTE